MTQLGTLRGSHYRKTDGSQAEGSILIELLVSPPTIRDEAGNVIWAGDITVPLAGGAFTVNLPAGDGLSDPAISPSVFSYRVTEQLKHVPKPKYRTVIVQVPTGGTLDLADVEGGVAATPVLAQPITQTQLENALDGYVNPVLGTYVTAAQTAETNAETAETNAETAAAAAQTAQGLAEDARDTASEIALGDADATLATAIGNPASDTYAALSASTIGFIRQRSAWSIIDVVSGSVDNWPAQLTEAFGNEEDATFTAPAGLYYINDRVDIRGRNSLIFDRNATFRAGDRIVGPMFNYEPPVDSDFSHFHGLPTGKLISGGIFDGNDLADTVLRIAVFLGLQAEGCRILNFRNRGLVVDRNIEGTSAPAKSAEFIARGFHFMNYTDDYLADNAAVEVFAGDNHFHDFVGIDATFGVIDHGGNVWNNPHFWVSQAARYPGSVAYDLRGSSRMLFPYADTYQVGWLIRAGVPSLIHPNNYINSEFITPAINALNHPSILQFVGGEAKGVHISHGVFANYIDSGVPATGADETTFIDNPELASFIHIDDYSRFENFAPDRYFGAPGAYHYGKLQGDNGGFTATLVAAGGGGGTSYTQQDGHLSYDRDLARITIQMKGYYTSGATGTIRLPIPITAAAPAVGRAGYASGLGAGTVLPQIGEGENFITLLSGDTNPVSALNATAVEAGGTGQFDFTVSIDIPT